VSAKVRVSESTEDGRVAFLSLFPSLMTYSGTRRPVGRLH
jgi:hypothetical protein